MSHVYCPECGFQNPEAANFCARCGAHLTHGEAGLQNEHTSIGRSPDCDIFLDDVTVSRKHAVLVNEEGRFYIEDQGSLNGTFVNRRRIERADLENGDELQVGKYRMTFLAK